MTESSMQRWSVSRARPGWGTWRGDWSRRLAHDDSHLSDARALRDERRDFLDGFRIACSARGKRDHFLYDLRQNALTGERSKDSRRDGVEVGCASGGFGGDGLLQKLD